MSYLGHHLNYAGHHLNYFGPHLNYVEPHLNYVGSPLNYLGPLLNYLGPLLNYVPWRASCSATADVYVRAVNGTSASVHPCQASASWWLMDHGLVAVLIAVLGG